MTEDAIEVVKAGRAAEAGAGAEQVIVHGPEA